MPTHKHVTSACINCRRRKVKCTGQQPCINCDNSNQTCEYSAECDMRKLSSRKVISSLEARLAQLEKAINSKEASKAGAYEQLPGKYFVQSLPQEGSAGESSDIGEESPGVGRIGIEPAETNPAVSGGKTAPIDPDLESTSSSALEHLGPSNETPPCQPGIEDLDARSNQGFSSLAPENQGSGSDSQKDNCSVTDLLAGHIGSLRLAEDGQLRYYGSTSNLHFQHNGFPTLSHALIRNVSSEGDGALKHMGLNQHVPLALEMHLAKLFFSWQYPAVHVVDEEVFFQENNRSVVERQRSSYYSETLNNAICALGARLAHWEDIDAPLADPEFYSSRAKVLLDIEMDSPAVATVQALIIMSASEAVSMRDARGWLYSGMASRLCTDLGLHLGLAEQAKSELLSRRDLYIRQLTFDGVFTHESMWSLYVGRPGDLEVSNIRRPNVRSSLQKDRIWRPCGAKSQSEVSKDEGYSFQPRECVAAIVSLSAIMRAIHSTLYSKRVLGTSSLVGFLLEINQRLEHWLATLPPSLSINLTETERGCIPAVFQIHLQYYHALISLYRPYMSSTFSQDLMASSSDPGSSLAQQARPRCVSASLSIASLLRRYKMRYSLRSINVQAVHIAFTAALVFIHDACVRPHVETQQTLSGLQCCCHALSEMGQYYGNATRALETIIQIKSEWQRPAAMARARSSKLKRSKYDTPGVQQTSTGLILGENKRIYTATDPTGETPDVSMLSVPEPFGFSDTFGHGCCSQRQNNPMWAEDDISLHMLDGDEGLGPMNTYEGWMSTCQSMSDWCTNTDLDGLARPDIDFL